MRNYIKNFIRKSSPKLFRYITQYRLINSRLPQYFKNDLMRLNSYHTVIDLGANIGNISEIMAKTGANVIAFEPSSRAFEQLTKFMKRYSNVKIYNQAAGIQERRVKLFLNQETRQKPDLDLTQSSSLFAEKPNVSQNIFDEVLEIDFAEYIKNLNTIVEILKVDIEGYEIPLINHLIDTDAISLINNIYVETHEIQFPSLLNDTLALKNRIEKLGLASRFRFDWH